MAIVSGMAVRGSDATNSVVVRSHKPLEYEVNKVTRALQLLELVRSRGCAVDDEKDDPGVLCVGAAFVGDGGPAGAVSIAGLKAGMPEWRSQELGRTVRARAEEMTMSIGGEAWRAPFGGRA